MPTELERSPTDSSLNEPAAGLGVKVFGIDLVGVNAENGTKLLMSLVFVLAVVAGGALLRWVIGRALRKSDHTSTQTRFWSRQAVSLLTAVVLAVGVLSIWFNGPARLATAFGLMSAGLAFALQQVITAIAGYLVLLRGSTFTVGDRISMGGVRGDVIRLGFIQTTIMEMGQPPRVQSADPAMWVQSRQFTGRIVTVSNARIFSDPVYNYTRDFPFIWDEMIIPITYKEDRARVEAILLEAAHRHAVDANTMTAEAKAELQRRFHVEPVDIAPKVFYRITDNWLELTVRFLAGTHGVRDVKDAMSRYVVDEFDRAGIGIASATYDIVGFPPIELRTPQKPM